jgi:hypothetical protein
MTKKEQTEEKQSFALEILKDLKEERNRLLVANIIQSISLILAIVGLLMK